MTPEHIAEARVRAYLARKAIDNRYYSKHIHGYDVSKDNPEGISLTVSDLTALLDALTAANTRIEALTAENAKLHDHIEGVAKDTHKIMVGYEAKLTKAVEAMTTEPTDEMIASACMWHRHDFGLLDEEQRQEWMLVAREWWRAAAKEMQHRAALTHAKETPHE